MNAPRTPRRRSRSRHAEQSFYASALSEAERPQLREARGVEGLDEEVALLRLRLREALGNHPDDFRLMQNGVRLLVQALLARHRLSPKQADNLSEAAVNLLEEFGEVLRDAGQGVAGE